MSGTPYAAPMTKGYPSWPLVQTDGDPSLPATNSREKPDPIIRQRHNGGRSVKAGGIKNQTQNPSLLSLPPFLHLTIKTRNHWCCDGGIGLARVFAKCSC
ncbi:hypothetical protein R6Q57_001700 [Mikania cordata]